ncbi:hypothetical protein DQ04_11111010 [Trypanosoma grayi]|uniref:hypothetical protein n=1 Tax=Trypanosoma grayi TaxID=71804 RepID=UPI0004F414BB|nr:hypothetical protein DQ04_11111010 [Trypanosoma grayi]KEG07049.1 hypothetical protein DQ04_11111010 [Trypanosoma grayi]
MARAQLAEENLKIQQDAYAQTAGSHKRINKIQHQINTLESQKTQLCEEKIQMQDRINQMQAWCAQREEPTGLPVQPATTEGDNDFSPQAFHTSAHTAKMDGHAERSSFVLGAPPQVGLRGIQELKNKFVDKGFRPEENIRTFEGAMEYLVETSPEQLLAAYRDLFPLPIRPGFELCQAWDNFVAWIYAIRHEGMSAEQSQLGRRLYYQLRVAQAAKENPGVNIQTLANAISDPRKEEDPVFQAVQKAKKHSAHPPSYARCFRCGRTGHYSTTCYVQVKKTPFKPKNDYRPRKQ